MKNLDEPAFPTKGDEVKTGLTKGELFTMMYLSFNYFTDPQNVSEDLKKCLNILLNQQ